MVPRGQEHGRHPRREDRVIEVAELVEPPPEAQVELAEEDLVLEVGSEFVAILARRGDGDVEIVAASADAVAQEMTSGRRGVGSHDPGVPDLEIVGLGLEVQLERGTGGTHGQEGRRLRVDDVGEAPEPELSPRVLDLAVAEEGAALDVEGTERRVDDALGPGDASRIRDVRVVGELLVHARVEPGLARALVLERQIGGAAVGDRGVERVLHDGDRARRTGQGIRVEVATRETIGPAFVRSLADARGSSIGRSRALPGERPRVPIEGSPGEG